MKNQRGFMMIEIMVAMTVALIGLAGVLTLHNTVVRNASLSAQQASATGYAQSQIERLRNLNVTALQARYGALPLANVALGTTTDRGVAYQSWLDAVTPALSSGLVRLQVRVQWTDPAGDAHTVTLETLKNRVDGM